MNILSWLLEALCPKRCIICNQEGSLLCKKHKILPSAPKNLANFSHLDDIFAGTFYYDEIVKKIVECYKFQFMNNLAEIMAEDLTKKISKHCRHNILNSFDKPNTNLKPKKSTKNKTWLNIFQTRDSTPSNFKKTNDNIALVPIPLHWTRMLTRGFNQSKNLAKNLHSNFPHISVQNILIRKKKTQQQSQLDKKSREKNLKNAFAVKQNSKMPEIVILVDDVVASGSTLDNAAQTLKNVGVKKVYGLVFARGGKK